MLLNVMDVAEIDEIAEGVEKKTELRKTEGMGKVTGQVRTRHPSFMPS